MRILYFSRDYTTHDHRFLSKIAESGHEVLFLRLQDDGGAYETRQLPEGVRLLRWEGVDGPVTPEACLARMPRFAAVLASAVPDVVHAGPIPTCAFMVALAGFHPLLSMSWGSDILVEAKEDPLADWTTNYALARSDAFAVDCDAVRHAITARVGADESRFVQFPWGLELKRFPRRAAKGRRDGEITVLSTRSWAPIYGVETAIEAFALAYREEPRLRLVLVGDGPLAAQVRTAIAAHGVSESVRLTGRIPEEKLGAYFADADIYVSCARSDGTSVSLLEAMANGLPVVATDAPGNREWVANERGGWLAPAGDADAFARGILRAAALDAEGRDAIAKHNRDLVEHRADWHANTKRLLAAYERLASVRALHREP